MEVIIIRINYKRNYINIIITIDPQRINAFVPTLGPKLGRQIGPNACAFLSIIKINIKMGDNIAYGSMPCYVCGWWVSAGFDDATFGSRLEGCRWYYICHLQCRLRMEMWLRWEREAEEAAGDCPVVARAVCLVRAA